MYFPKVAHPTADSYVFGPNEIGIASEGQRDNNFIA